MAPSRTEIDRKLHGSLLLVTALVPHIGYDQAAQVAKHAHALSLRDRRHRPARAGRSTRCGSPLTAVREDVPLDDVGVTVNNVTTLLRAWCQRGDGAAFDKVWPLIYDEMQRLAVRLLQRERSGHTLAPNDLIHEAYLRLAGGMQLDFADRAHFFAIAARCMRRILVDRARRRHASKRGSGHRPTVLDENCIAIDRSPDLVALDDALDELAKHSERKARVIELHYFGGLTQDEIAAVCDVHVNTVARDLRFSEAWLRRHLAAS